MEHLVLEGSHFEVGRLRGETLMKYPKEVEYYSKPLSGDSSYLSSQKVKEIMDIYDRYCPGLNEEIEGFANALGIDPKQVVYYANSYERNYGCCQIAIMPKMTQDNHLLIGRSYEFYTDDEKRLCTYRVKGKYAHIGFSLHLFGRFDGIRFWTVIRVLLDNCKSTKEALYVLKNLPISANVNFMIADKNDVVLVEVSCLDGHRDIRVEEAEDYLISTNHYTIPEMEKYNTRRMNQSVMRFEAAKSVIEQNKGNINKETIRQILTKPLPQGVCCNYYEDGLGTLHSMIFDLTDISTEICLGAPSINPWKKYDFYSDEVGSRAYQVPYVNEYPSEPKKFWGFI